MKIIADVLKNTKLRGKYPGLLWTGVLTLELEYLWVVVLLR
jgi:hypothetical protein